ncbi:MAG: hypothetical protein PHT47_01745, partial [Candidatus Cloacimonetes bacterium]|nr:hypothetical protein [Candidatus Cloacimonadota bacterium]MDD4099797.1 hypothetical protein [Candidatus Cloacimonadota bacterium]MDD4805908.1 hypothetical protein [Candidatus Cloacimonadota bacterium]
VFRFREQLVVALAVAPFRNVAFRSYDWSYAAFRSYENRGVGRRPPGCPSIGMLPNVTQLS